MDTSAMLTEAGLLLADNYEPILRLALAAALGAIIGLEREASGKPAGFRTNLLICLGAALVTQLSLDIAADGTLPGGLRSDPGRIAAQIVSGIGFLGAGTILHSRGSVTGLTTAATLWVVAAIGMATGAGAYVMAVASTVFVMLALILLGRLETDVLTSASSGHTLRITAEARPEVVAAVGRILEAAGVKLVEADVRRETDAYTLSYTTRPSDGDLDAAVERLLRLDSVRRVTVI